jgi:hypothetical protein
VAEVFDNRVEVLIYSTPVECLVAEGGEVRETEGANASDNLM